MKLATSPDGSQVKECLFDSIEVAETLALAILRAAVRAREQRKTTGSTQEPPVY
jgi:hypothetical protein